MIYAAVIRPIMLYGGLIAGVPKQVHLKLCAPLTWQQYAEIYASTKAAKSAARANMSINSYPVIKVVHNGYNNKFTLCATMQEKDIRTLH